MRHLLGRLLSARFPQGAAHARNGWAPAWAPAHAWVPDVRPVYPVSVAMLSSASRANRPLTIAETASKVPPAPSRRQVGTDAALVADSKDANEAARFAPSSGHGRRRWYNGTTELAPIDKRRAALVLARRTGTWVLNRLASGWLFIILLAYPSHVTNEEELTPPQYKESLYDDAKQDICRVADWIMGRKQESGGDNDKDNAAHLE